MLKPLYPNGQQQFSGLLPSILSRILRMRCLYCSTVFLNEMPLWDEKKRLLSFPKNSVFKIFSAGIVHIFVKMYILLFYFYFLFIILGIFSAKIFWNNRKLFFLTVLFYKQITVHIYTNLKEYFCFNLTINGDRRASFCTTHTYCISFETEH